MGQELLIKNTIVAVNQANITGNFTVLRDLTSQRLREEITSADLAAICSSLRRMDLSPVLILHPKLTEPASFFRDISPPRQNDSTSSWSSPCPQRVG